VSEVAPEPRPALTRWYLLLGLPMLVAFTTDLLERPTQLMGLRGWSNVWYVLALIESATVWGLLLYSSAFRGWSGRVASVLFVVGFTFALGGQVYFFEQYRAYLSQDLALFAANLTDSVINQLAADVGHYLRVKLPFLVFSGLLVWLAHWQHFRPWNRGALLGPLAFVAAWFIPTQYRSPQAATPDTLYLNALGAFVRSELGLTDASKNVRPGVRHALAVPSLVESAAPQVENAASRRNVFLILTESVRADAACSKLDLDCRLTPYTNVALPERIALPELRAVDSTTAISLAVLLTGLGPNASYERLHEWPTLFDYARAAGYHTAYWTSQNLFFANSRLFVKDLGVDSMTSGTELDPEADIDMGADEKLLADKVIERFGSLPEPFFALVHLSATHYPYRVSTDRPQPFQPAALDRGPDGRVKLRNHYQNAIVQQDEQVARMISALKNSPAGARTVIVFTSDHGEAMGEHGQTGHTFSLFDEEIHVPGYIDAPAASLTPSERATLLAQAGRFIVHPDLSATVLDLLGVWQTQQTAKFRSEMLGHSLLRPLPESAALPLTNCASLWTCAFENWGALRGPFKLIGRTPFDQGWQCFDLRSDPREQDSLSTDECSALQTQTLTWFGRAPR
jgi:glucan phosphoethanolaminetransferase (alkaline phosphatase superfamily)